MYKKALILAIILTLPCIALSQKERIEVKIMECTYQAFKDNGTNFKTLIASHEQLLVEEGILADVSGTSYRKAFEDRMSSEYLKAPSKSFYEVMNTIAPPSMTSYNQCYQTITKDSLQYDFTTYKKYQNALISINNPQNDFASISKEVLSVLSSEDFELDFYKMSTFILFEMLNTDSDSGIVRRIPEQVEASYSEEDLKNAFKIHMNADSNVEIDGNVIDAKKVKSQVITYLQTHKSKAIISFTSERETSYRSYIAVQNEIVAAYNFVRNELAQKQFKTSYDKLTEEQTQQIKAIYPQKLIEGLDN